LEKAKKMQEIDHFPHFSIAFATIVGILLNDPN